MKGILKNYADMAILLACLIVAGVCGALWPDAARVVKPVGDIFLNLLFVLVVPMVFFSVTMSFVKMRTSGSCGSVLARAGIAFVLLWVLAGALAYLSGLIASPLGPDFNTEGVIPEDCLTEAKKGADAIVGSLSVSDFPMLFSKFSLLPLIIFSALLGLGVAAAGEKGTAFSAFLEAGSEVSVKTMGILMKAAPVGLGCYFASTIANMGGQLLGGYLRVFVIYCCTAVVMFFVVNPLLVLLAKGRTGLRNFWRHILPPTLTALATSSSTVAMMGNVEAAKGTGVSDSVAESIVPLSTNLLKAGSVINGVYKVMFLMLLTGGSYLSLSGALTCIGCAIIAAVVSGAVTNGGITGEILICTLMGVDPAMVGIVMIIGTICDVPATVINSQSNVVAAVLADKKS